MDRLACPLPRWLSAHLSDPYRLGRSLAGVSRSRSLPANRQWRNNLRPLVHAAGVRLYRKDEAKLPKLSTNTEEYYGEWQLPPPPQRWFQQPQVPFDVVAEGRAVSAWSF